MTEFSYRTLDIETIRALEPRIRRELDGFPKSRMNHCLAFPKGTPEDFIGSTFQAIVKTLPKEQEEYFEMCGAIEEKGELLYPIWTGYYYGPGPEFTNSLLRSLLIVGIGISGLLAFTLAYFNFFAN